MKSRTHANPKNTTTRTEWANDLLIQGVLFQNRGDSIGTTTKKEGPFTNRTVNGSNVSVRSQVPSAHGTGANEVARHRLGLKRKGLRLFHRCSSEVRRWWLLLLIVEGLA